MYPFVLNEKYCSLTLGSGFLPEFIRTKGTTGMNHKAYPQEPIVEADQKEANRHSEGAKRLKNLLF